MGGYGLDAHWSDDFHHAVHVALTGERAGYYADFGGVGAGGQARSARRYVHDGRYSPLSAAAARAARGGRARPTGSWSACRTTTRSATAPAASGSGDAGLEPAALRLAAAMLLLSPYVPLLFMGEEYGETNPFLYFVSHGDPALVEAVREGRRREFAAFGWAGKIPDPQARRPSRRRGRIGSAPDHRRWHARCWHSTAICSGSAGPSPLLRPGAAEPAVRHDEQAGVGGVRCDEEDRCWTRCSTFAIGARDVPLAGSEPWRLALSTDAPEYGGRGGTGLAGPTVSLALPSRTAVAAPEAAA